MNKTIQLSLYIYVSQCDLARINHHIILSAWAVQMEFSRHLDAILNNTYS